MNDPADLRPGQSIAARFRGRSAGCQPLSLWLEVCAGTIPNQDSIEHLEHASECRDCSRLLSQALAILAPEPAAEEHARLNDLSSSSSAGQERLAARLRAVVSRNPPPLPQSRSFRRPRNHFFPLFFWSAAGICALVIAAFVLLYHPSDATLLAQAYDQQRPSALRLPGTDPGPVASPTRGSVPSPDSSELLRLKLRTNESFEKQPNDAHTRQMLGRIALVEHNGEAARSHFEIAEALNPKLPGLTADLASAYFELAESSGQPIDYARAVDLFSQHLQEVHQADPVALYNRALCWERQAIAPNAIADFQAALALEKDSRWRRDIESRLQRLRRSAQSETSQQPLPAAVFLSQHDDPPGQFEMLLSLASREWLPRRATDPQADLALRKLALLGRQHHDLWIADMLAAPENPMRQAADQALASALAASSAGNADQALQASATAMRLYRALSRNPERDPGYLRAAVEHLYTLQRMGLNDECLREAAALAENRQLVRYAWLRSYLELETAAAYGMLGDARRDRALSSAVAARTASDGLPLTSLRATSFAVTDDAWLKQYESAWQEGIAALQLSEGIRGAAMPRFQVLAALVSIGKDLNLPWTAAGLASAAASTVSATSNHKAAAYAVEELGLDEMQVGDLAKASQSFRHADALMAQLGSGAAARRYEADWNSDRALFLARTQGAAAAGSTLARQEPEYQQFDALLPRVHFYTAYADLLRQSGEASASLDEAVKAVALAQRSLAGTSVAATSGAALSLAAAQIRPDTQNPIPQPLAPDIRTAYEILVADLSDNASHPELALRAWELLQSGGMRAAFTELPGNSAPQLDDLLPPLPAAPPGDLTLVLARVLDRYILWSFGPGEPVRQSILKLDPRSLARRADTFLRLCADPHSSIDDLAILGAGLYNDLLAPADVRISRAARINLELDPSLSPIPFAALQHGGRYLGVEHALTILPAGWSTAAPSQPDQLPATPHITVLEQAAASGAATQRAIPTDYDESGDIRQLFPSTQIVRATLARSGAGLALDGAASLRPLLARADVIHYVGHGLDESPAESPAATQSSATTLELTAQSIPHCRLAVLAACHTLGEREESREDVPSFAHMVMAAGASRVLATQWDVDSRQTSRLMQRFYAALAARSSFPEALRQAQQSLESDPASAHPYFWSGFQLVGNP